jgi:hypothetical protein
MFVCANRILFGTFETFHEVCVVWDFDVVVCFVSSFFFFFFFFFFLLFSSWKTEPFLFSCCCHFPLEFCVIKGLSISPSPARSIQHGLWMEVSVFFREHESLSNKTWCFKMDRASQCPFSQTTKFRP